MVLESFEFATELVFAFVLTNKILSLVSIPLVEIEEIETIPQIVPRNCHFLVGTLLSLFRVTEDFIGQSAF